MDDHISVSLIIPAYNTEKWIEDCLESAVNQTIAFDEIIIIDDGSTDSTGIICDEYAFGNNNIRVYHQANKGQGAARNWGIREAKSNYIMFLDSDDCLEINALEELKGSLNEDLDGVLFDASIFGDKRFIPEKNVYDREKVVKPRLYWGYDFFEKYYPGGFQASACLAIYKKSHLDEKGIFFPEGVIYEDNVFSFKYILEAEKIKYIGKKLYKRRYRENSTMTGRYGVYNMNSHIECAKLIFKYVFNLSNEYCSEKVMRYVSSWGGLLATNWSRISRDESILTDRIRDMEKILKEAFGWLLSLYKDGKFNLNVEPTKTKILLYRFSSIAESMLGMFSDNSENRNEFNSLKEWGRAYFSNYFNQLGLESANTKIGIYGVGKYCKSMMETYKKIYGYIPNLSFIDSYKNGADFMGTKVLPIEEIVNLNVILVAVRGEESYEIVNNIKRLKDGMKIVNLFELDPINQFSFSEYFIF